MNALSMTALGTGFTFLMTAAGASVVFFFRKEVSHAFQRVFLGFAAGVMVAASVWSLLIPAIEMAEEAGGLPGWVPAAGGFLLGAAFLLVLDAVMPHLHPGAREPEGPHTPLKRTTLLVLAVTLHNIPEGMAVGLACALAASAESVSGGAVTMASALALALGIGLQNFPEGAAISLPLRREGLSPHAQLCIRRTLWHCRACGRHFGRAGGRWCAAADALVFKLCGGRHDLCGGGRADSRGKFGRAFSHRHMGRAGWLCYYDGDGCGPWLNPGAQRKGKACFSLPPAFLGQGRGSK